jgi:hypothetical protein
MCKCHAEAVGYFMPRYVGKHQKSSAATMPTNPVNTGKPAKTRRFKDMIKILFVCHGNRRQFIIKPL